MRHENEFMEHDSKKWRLICKLDGTTAFCYVHDVPEFQSELSLSPVLKGCLKNKSFVKTSIENP